MCMAMYASIKYAVVVVSRDTAFLIDELWEGVHWLLRLSIVSAQHLLVVSSSKSMACQDPRPD